MLFQLSELRRLSQVLRMLRSLQLDRGEPASLPGTLSPATIISVSPRKTSDIVIPVPWFPVDKNNANLLDCEHLVRLLRTTTIIRRLLGPLSHYRVSMTKIQIDVQREIVL